MKNFITIIVAALSLASLWACQKNVEEPETDGNTVTLTLDFHSSLTKSVLGTPSEIENKLSNVLIIMYRVSDGVLDKSVFVTEDKAGINLVSGMEYNIYCIANLESEDEITVPMTEKEIRNLRFRIPTYGRMAEKGLPASAVIQSVCVDKSSEIKVCLERLMARVCVRIRSEELTAGEDDVLRNVKMYIRNANSMLSPFKPEGSRAEQASDIVQLSDYDPEMSSTGDDLFTFYVPENMQGNLLQGNIDPSLKTSASLLAAGADDAVATYVEFTAYLNPRRAGYGGELIYRFYIGKDNTSNFDIQRNKAYDIELNLSSENLMSPYWKVSHGDDWSDGRVLRLMTETGELLPDGQVLAVRPNRPASFRIFTGYEDSDDNLFSIDGRSPYGSDDIPTSVNVINWTSNVISSDSTNLKMPSLLAKDGLKASITDDGVLRITVIDPSRVVQGKEYDISVMLVPGREKYTKNIRVRVLPSYDISSSTDLNKFFLAQKVELSVDGAMGTTLNVEDIGNRSMLEFDRIVMRVSDLSASFSAFGTIPGNTVIKVTSDDPINDPPLLLPLTVRKPVLALKDDNGQLDRKSVLLTFDGVARKVGYAFFESMESDAKELPVTCFEKSYYDKLLSPSIRHYPGSMIKNPERHFHYDSARDSVYLENIVAGDVNLWKYRRSLECFDTLRFVPGNNERGLFADSEFPELLLYLDDPFPDYAGETIDLGTFKYDGTTEEGLSGNSFQFKFRLNADPGNLSLEYDGLMKPKYGIEKTHGNECRCSVRFDWTCISAGGGTDAGIRHLELKLTNIRSGQSVCERYSITNYIKARLGVIFDTYWVWYPLYRKTHDDFSTRGVKAMWYDTYLKLKSLGNKDRIWEESSDYGFAGNASDFVYIESTDPDVTELIEGRNWYMIEEVFPLPTAVLGPTWNCPDIWDVSNTWEFFDNIESSILFKDPGNPYLEIDTKPTETGYVGWMGSYDRKDFGEPYEYIDYK